MRSFLFLATISLSFLAFSSSVEEVQETIHVFGETFKTTGALIGEKCPNLAKSQEQRDLIDSIILYGDANAQAFIVCSPDDLATVQTYSRCVYDVTVAHLATGDCNGPLTEQTNVCNKPFVLSQVCEYAIRDAISMALATVTTKQQTGVEIR